MLELIEGIIIFSLIVSTISHIQLMKKVMHFIDTALIGLEIVIYLVSQGSAHCPKIR